MIKCNRKFAFPDNLVPPSPPPLSCRNQFEKLRTDQLFDTFLGTCDTVFDTADYFYLLEDKRIRGV